MKRLFAVLALLPSYALAESQWVKVWEGDESTPQGSVHIVEEADLRTRKHTGTTSRFVERTSMTLGTTYIVGISTDTFDCEQATYTMQTGGVGPGPTIQVKVAAEMALFQFACRE